MTGRSPVTKVTATMVFVSGSGMPINGTTTSR
ncbi:hypothetical protein MPOCJGCO_2807 [Methylobacterium trifolii]|uniref:Uncharacterized protein n=1 Tax=Methylobacterium trifolii TaxID=1003092 RepID=A0ABQ4U128_9HYPH|nr:hypothetical protein MPOCJGCO_2807 [Methylobacterium trifolii]